MECRLQVWISRVTCEWVSDQRGCDMQGMLQVWMSCVTCECCIDHQEFDMEGIMQINTLKYECLVLPRNIHDIPSWGIWLYIYIYISYEVHDFEMNIHDIPSWGIWFWSIWFWNAVCHEYLLSIEALIWRACCWSSRSATHNIWMGCVTYEYDMSRVTRHVT